MQRVAKSSSLLKIGADLATGILKFTLALLWVVPVSVYSGDYKCITNQGTLTITAYTGPGGGVTIPDRINGLAVTCIGNGAFLFCDNLTSVTIPQTVTTIGHYAFNCCCGLTTLNLPDNVTNVGDSAFQYCTGLTNVVIGKGVSSITRYEFDGCTSLASVTILPNITSIGDYAFRSCTSLTNVTIANTITNIGTFAFGFCSGLSCVSLPDSLYGIGDFVFYHCTNLINVTLGSGITNISSHMFDGCAYLRSLTIPSSITSIGDYAFSYCSSLTAVYFKGDAPLVDSPVFAGDDNVVVYYWPGSCGWSCSYAGCSALLWNVQTETCDFSLAVSNNEFGFNIIGPNNIAFVVEACTNLANPTWCSLQTIYIPGGRAHFSDPQSRNYPTRFYRIRTP
ncbi:MAG TPA: leucine-rich repeat domain-containing protein [Candidatus Limnocylindrales bacterium]|nr:leucine-rich repeat domain-containing protein [Candidatus Limnocylindrales bacterium]